jgi:predicted site-specific integrase-resolvase
MKFVKRFLPLMVVGILIFASCATNTGQVPKEAETPPVTQEAQPQEQPQQPSVEKYELQNLFQQANTLKAEATDFDLNSVDPDGFLAASNKHDAVAAQYQDLVETPAEYDGVKAYPLKQDLEDLVAAWTQVVEKGLPLRADAEKNAADETRAAAMNADAPSQAPAQYDAGLQYYSQASTEYDAANYKEAITSYQLAGAAFDSAAAAAEVNVLRADIEKNGYSGYESIQTYFSMGEDKYKEAQDLWQKNTLDDIKASTAAFKEAQSYYSFVETKGSELKAIEGKDKAVAAQEEALQVKADVNAPDDYQQAVDILAEADKNMQDGSYASAYSGYLDAVSAFEASRDVASAKEQEVTDAIAKAETGFAEAKDRASELGLEENIYLTAAAEHLDKAKALKEEVQYNDALFETNEVFNYIGLSDNFVQEETQTREKARLEQLEKDKAAADAAIADAKTRIAWADEVDLKSDYPQEYTDASTSMSGAEIAYNNEKYAPAKTLAEEVSTTLSDEFQQQVLAAREAAKAKAAQADEEARQKAADKEAADAAIADAEARMAWANENQVRTDYPDQYQESSVAMVGAYVAYGNEDYVLSKEKAEEVSGILSNDFQAQVASERAAKEQLAKDKATADEVLPKARERMAWADQNNIKAEYPQEYTDASTSMSGAEIAYNNEKYAPATELANEVLSILSPDFEAKVTSDRATKEQAEIEKASNAANALGEAHSRMAWADQVGLASDYPDEYRDADTSMQAADAAYSQKEYDATVTLSNDVLRILSDDFMTKVNGERDAAVQLAKDKATADEVLPKARERMAWADQNNIKAEYPQEYTDASTSMSGAEIAYNNEKYAPATELANEVLSILSPDFEAKVAADRAEKAKQTSEAAIAENMKYAQTAIADAQSRYDWAASKNAANNYPELFKQGGDALADAKTAFNALDYTRAKDLAAQSYWALMQINEFAPLPATYVVRLIPQRRDCLWRIAEYAFIYNNPYKWPVLYQANKATFKDPSNPDLIFPGQVLKIPSIKGETRDGVWDPNKTYQPLAK